MIVASFLTKDLTSTDAGEKLLCTEAHGLRSRGQQWKLAVVRVDQLRCAAIFSDFQSLATAETVRS